MKVSSILAGALAAVVSATPIPGKEISKRGSFASQLAFGSLFGANFNVGGNAFLADPLLQHFALVNNLDFGVIQGFAVNNGVALDDLIASLAVQNQFGNIAVNQLLNFHSALLLSWLGKNNFFSDINFNGGLLPSSIDFGLAGAFGIEDAIIQLAIDEIAKQQILDSVVNFGAFGGGFGGNAAVIQSTSTVIVKE